MHEDGGRLAIPEEGGVHGKTRGQRQQRLFQHTAWQGTALSTHPYSEMVSSAYHTVSEKNIMNTCATKDKMSPSYVYWWHCHNWSTIDHWNSVQYSLTCNNKHATCQKVAECSLQSLFNVLTCLSINDKLKIIFRLSGHSNYWHMAAAMTYKFSKQHVMSGILYRVYLYTLYVSTTAESHWTRS